MCDVIADELVTKAAGLKVVAKFDVANTGEFTFDQFKSIMDDIEELIDGDGDNEDGDDHDDNQSLPASTAGKGFGTSTTMNTDTNTNDVDPTTSEADEVTRDIFDDLRSENSLLSVQAFKEWEDMASLIDNGSIKRSTLEKAIVKVGAYDNGEMSYEQCVALIERRMKSIDASQL